MDMLVEDVVSKPYILYITAKQELELRNYMEQKEWEVRIFFCIHPGSRPTIDNLLPDQLKVNSDEESTHQDSKTYHVNDVKFTEVSLFEDVAKVHNYLSFAYDEEDTENSETKVLYDIDENLDNISAANPKLKTVRDFESTSNCFKNLDEQNHRSIRLMKPYKNSQKDVKDLSDISIARCNKNDDSLIDTESTDKQDNGYSDEQGTHVKLDVDDAVDIQTDSSVEWDNHSELSVNEENKPNIIEFSQGCSFVRESFGSIGLKITEKKDLQFVQNSDTNVDRERKQFKPTSKSSTPNTASKCMQRKRKSTGKVKVNGKRKSISERQSSLKCNVCGKALASEKFYERHMKIKHSDTSNRNGDHDVVTRKRVSSDHANVCTVCQKQFCDKYTLQTHTRHMHSDNLNGHQCDLCGAVLKFKGSLAQHMKSVHTDKRPHHCNICNKQFKVLHQLKNHQRRHDPDHVDTCTICGKTVKKGQLSGHIKRHRDDKKHACSTCEKKFFEKQDLLRHLRIHSGEKPFKCSHCSYTCAIKGNLTKHIIHKHKEGQYSLEFNEPMQYVAKRLAEDNGHPPVGGETTTNYVLARSETDIGPHVHNETFVKRNSNVELTNPYGVTQVHPDGASVFYNMRPVVRFGQTDDQTTTSSSATRDSQSRIVEGQVMSGSMFTYTCNVGNTSDPGYT